MRKSIIASVLSFSTLGAAHAQPPAPMICELGGACVYDKNGFIGVLADMNNPVLTRKLDGGKTYAIPFISDKGVVPVAASVLVYPNATCADPPYMELNGMFPNPAIADENKTMWAASTPAVESTFTNVWQAGPGGCKPLILRSPITVALAAVVDTTVVKTWVPPFSITPPGTSGLASRD
jgi:hypothetical protein